MKQLAKNVDRYSIIRLQDGRLAVWERKGMTAIVEWNKSGVKLSGDTEVEVVKSLAHLAADYLESNQNRKTIDEAYKSLLEESKSTIEWAHKNMMPINESLQDDSFNILANTLSRLQEMFPDLENNFLPKE